MDFDETCILSKIFFEDHFQCIIYDFALLSFRNVGKVIYSGISDYERLSLLKKPTEWNLKRLKLAQALPKIVTNCNFYEN